MILNIGAGKQRIPGHYCIDAQEHPKARRPLDLRFTFEFDGARLRHWLPLDNCTADEIHNYHFIEHFYEWEAPALVGEFFRLLKPGGRLVVECPDIMKCAKNLLNGATDQLCMFGFYGDGNHQNPFMCHKFGYSPKTIKRLLSRQGFDNIQFEAPQTHGRRIMRDMRVTANKPI